MFIVTKKRAIKELEDLLVWNEESYEEECKRADKLGIIDYDLTPDAIYKKGVITGIKMAIKRLS